MRALSTTTAMIVLAGGVTAGTAGTAGAVTGERNTPAAAACATPWGSKLKAATGTAVKPLTAMTTKATRCYDRLVFRIPGTSGGVGHHVGYVGTFRQDGSGDRIPVKGGAILQVYVGAPSYNPNTAKPTYPGRAGKALPGVNIAGYKTFKDTRFGASFEGQTQIALGVRARLPFRVQQSGDQLIVDVAHSW